MKIRWNNFRGRGRDVRIWFLSLPLGGTQSQTEESEYARRSPDPRTTSQRIFGQLPSVQLRSQKPPRWPQQQQSFPTIKRPLDAPNRTSLGAHIKGWNATHLHTEYKVQANCAHTAERMLRTCVVLDTGASPNFVVRKSTPDRSETICGGVTESIATANKKFNHIAVKRSLYVHLVSYVLRA